MDLFIALILIGLLGYEFYTGQIIVQNGARSKSLSRAVNPGTFWFWISVQVVIVVVMFLSWLEVINLPI